jgi:hypothetical protein
MMDLDNRYGIIYSTGTKAHIAGRLNSGFDREIGALPPHIYYINWGGLVGV